MVKRKGMVPAILIYPPAQKLAAGLIWMWIYLEHAGTTLALLNVSTECRDDIELLPFSISQLCNNL